MKNKKTVNMNMVCTLFILSIMTLFQVRGQTVVTDLFGFRIGQYRETASNELGKHIQQNKFDDGFEYEVFIVEPDSNLYLVFEYSAARPDVIWSIQISGSNTTSDLGFKDLKLGVDKKEVERVLGKPDMINDMGEYGENWAYNLTNYSVEISKENKLSSIKIIDNYSNGTPDLNKLPTFENIVKILGSQHNSEISNILSPAIEVYYKNQTLFFNKSIKTEEETDDSKIFQTIREISRGLEDINTADLDSYEENVRLVLGENPKHVIKIKTGHAIKEIVFEYINDEYLIWEIDAR